MKDAATLSQLDIFLLLVLSNYESLIESVGISKLDEANKETYEIVKQGSNNFKDPELWKEMLADADIKEDYELHTKALEKMAAKPGPKAKMKVIRKKKVTKAKVVKVDSKREPAPVPAKNKKAKSSKKVVKRKTKKGAVKAGPKKEIKFLVTVKKLSKELQLIKRMAAMDGKRKSVKALARLFADVAKILKTHPDRKPVLNDIHNRLKGALAKGDKAQVKELDIALDKSFKDRLMENARSASPKMKVEYLAGLSGKK